MNTIIRKALLIAMLAIVLIAPLVSANDGGSRPDTQRLSFTFTPISKEVKVGESFEFKVKVVNNTSREAWLIAFNQIFVGSYETENADVNGIIIPAYKTVTLDVSYVVPDSINWYEKNGKYYTDFSPEMYYQAKELLDWEEKDDWYDETDDSWDYYQLNNQLSPIEITNLIDGSEYASIRLLDQKTIVGFNDSAYKVSASWSGELVGEVYNRLQIENISDAAIENVHVYNNINYADINEYKIDQLGSKGQHELEHSSVYYLLENDIPQNMTIDYKAIFNVDDKYYCVHTSRDYKTEIYLRPDVKIYRQETDNEDTGRSTYSYMVENVSSQSIENFTVFFGDLYADNYSYSDWQEHTLSGEFMPGDTWNIPISFDAGSFYKIYVGYVVEDVFYCTWLDEWYWKDAVDTLVSINAEDLYFEDEIFNIYNIMQNKEADIQDLPIAEEYIYSDHKDTDAPTAAATPTMPASSFTATPIEETNGARMQTTVYFAIIMAVLIILLVISIVYWRGTKRQDGEGE
ncbi:MAG: hypothetical protein AB1Z23_01740 [Eubacteriales bacterium]